MVLRLGVAKICSSSGSRVLRDASISLNPKPQTRNPDLLGHSSFGKGT